MKFLIYFRCHLIHCGITDQSFCICEGNTTGCDPVSLIVSNDIHLPILKDPNARIGGTQINSNRWCFSLCHVIVLVEVFDEKNISKCKVLTD